MKCPHCLESFHRQLQGTDLGSDLDWGKVWVKHQLCPQCGRRIVLLEFYKKGGINSPVHVRVVYPKATARRAISAQDVPAHILEDYQEACVVFADSAKASAALSRRCLQNILREAAKVKAQDLSKEIDEVLQSRQLPTHLAEAIDAIRNVGNFAAHPIKSTSTGSVVHVEPGEAEWLLDVLEGMLDFYYVQPAVTQRKKGALNAKLAAAGKPPLK